MRKDISRPPTGWEVKSNKVFRAGTYVFAWATVLLILFIVFEIGGQAIPAIKAHGLKFITDTTWDPNKHQYGILPQIWGTLYSSVLALIFGTILGLAVAVFLSERFFSGLLFAILRLFGKQFHPFWGKLPNRMEGLLRNLVDLLAAIPSVVYGLWGIFVVIPLIRPVCDWLSGHLGWIPIFGSQLSGKGMLPASLVLAIMILPTISSISRDALVSVPPKLREAAYGLGATRWEAIIGVIIPTAQTGIMGSVLLAFGRALGETMALAMLVGGVNSISVSLFSPANTLAALLANNFPEANTTESISVLMYAALILMAITLAVNSMGALILRRSASMKGAPGNGRNSRSPCRPRGRAALAAALSGSDLQKSLRRPRTLFSFVMTTLVASLTVIALVPLFSVVYMLLTRGLSKISLSLFTTLPPAVLEEGGGFGNAVVGTIIIVAIAALISVPFGIMGAIYLAEVGAA